MEEALRAPNHLGHDCGFLRDDLCAVAVYQLAAILPGARTPHERGAGGRCCRRPLFFRLRRRGVRWLALRFPHEAWMDADGRPQTPDLMRSARHFTLYGGNGVGAIEHDRPDSDFRFAVPDLHLEQRRMGYGADRSADPIHGVFELYAELRRLSWRRACPNRDWVHRATHGQLLASADLERRSEPMFGSGLPATCRPADPRRRR